MFIEGKTVETFNPIYAKRKTQWQKVRDFIDGAETIKDKGEEYLPRAKGASDERYKAFKDRAVIVNYVSQTLSGVHGMVFRRAPVIEVPDDFRDFLDNIDLCGTSFCKFVSDSVYDSMQTCFGGYMADIPPAEAGISEQEAIERNIRVYATYYKGENIINWKKRSINGVEKLSLVVLRERLNYAMDEFSYDFIDRYRVLSLDENGLYKQRIYEPYKDKENEIDGYTVTEIPVTVKGKRLDFIPFVFSVSETPEKPMLSDITEVNIGHYQKTADYENGVHLTTIPTGWVTGEGPQVDENKNIIPICLGEDGFLMFRDPDTKVGVLNYAGEGLTHSENALEKSELQMVVLGSRIITPEKGISETAESANIHRAGENAKLATFANNVSINLSKFLNYMCIMAGIDNPKCSVHLNTDYETQGFDANALNAMANIFSQGKMPLIVLYGMMMRGEFLDAGMTFKDYVTLLDFENSGLTPNEAYEAYKKYKETGEMPDLPKKTMPTITLTADDLKDDEMTEPDDKEIGLEQK